MRFLNFYCKLFIFSSVNMKTLLIKVSVLIIWLVTVQRACASQDDDHKEFQLAMDYKKNNCSRSYESASPGADETTARCCARISVNHCYEKQYGFKFHIFLEPIIDESCREHLKDTLAMCNIDTSIYGHTITQYSLCRIKHQYMLQSYLSWEEENANLAYYENFHSSKKIQLGNHTFCCFKKALYGCFEEEVQAGCEKARLQMNESLRGDDSICGFSQFSNDVTICPDYTDCNLVQEKVLIEEERNYVFFGSTMLFMISVNSILIYYCFYKK